MSDSTEKLNYPPDHGSTEAPKEHLSDPRAKEIHQKIEDIQKDNFGFMIGFEKFSPQERQKLLEKATEWEKNSALDQFRSAGLSLDQLKKQPIDRHVQLAAMFLKHKPLSPKQTFICDFNGNDFAETQLDLSDIMPTNVLQVDVFDATGKSIFSKAERGFKDGKPGYFTADGKRVFLRDGFTIKVTGTQSELAMVIPKFGQQTYENTLKEQVYLAENAQKTELKKKTQEVAAKQGKTLITTPEFYDQSLTQITRSPKLADIFKNGKFDFSKIMDQIIKLVADFGVIFSQTTSDLTKSFDQKESAKLANPVPSGQSIPPAPEDLQPAKQTIADSSKYEALPANQRARKLVQVARGFVGSKDFRTPDVAGGNLACAKVASAILKEAGVLDHVILGVSGVQAELLRRGWQKHSAPAEAGDVVIWGRTPSRIVDGVARPGHGHIGIMTSAEYSVNNSSALKTPVETKVDFHSPRQVYLLRPPDRSSRSSSPTGIS